jgi:aryl-alcohol dehydrogenase-like predicted oxidoreductase
MTWEVFDVMQIVYGGLTRKSEVAIAKAASKGIGIIVRGVVKRYFDDYDELFENAGLDELRQDGESRNSFLIRFAMSHPGVSTMIIGTKSPDHLAENIQAATKDSLPDGVYAEAKRRLDAVGIVPG